jgi:hypothetical protein
MNRCIGSETQIKYKPLKADEDLPASPSICLHRQPMFAGIAGKSCFSQP